MLKGSLTGSKKYPANTIITDFQMDMDEKLYKFRYLLMGGQLEVQEEGVYYVFAQVFFENYPDASSIYHNRVELIVVSLSYFESSVAVMQTPIGNQADYGTESSGVVVKLNVGDRIGLKTVYESNIWLTKHHTFFGAYRID
ncbi:unnamed protein product [Porites lobata]|uniref:THD domain-containing protein n=1 Tax=Porites lobata TaxID=104759 RepID=A0ABN8Q3W0_9CNID|nr:unnamed protein product [Porites lobata]